jgi:uncharacterized protein (DUF1330 family)
VAAYLIVDVTVQNADRFGEYLAGTPTLANFGGRWLVRAATGEAFEGDWKPTRIGVIEFPDAERARAWYTSDTYQRHAKIRHEAADTRRVLLEGVA